MKKTPRLFIRRLSRVFPRVFVFGRLVFGVFVYGRIFPRLFRASFPAYFFGVFTFPAYFISNSELGWLYGWAGWLAGRLAGGS